MLGNTFVLHGYDEVRHLNESLQRLDYQLRIPYEWQPLADRAVYEIPDSWIELGAGPRQYEYRSIDFLIPTGHIFRLWQTPDDTWEILALDCALVRVNHLLVQMRALLYKRALSIGPWEGLYDPEDKAEYRQIACAFKRLGSVLRLTRQLP